MSLDAQSLAPLFQLSRDPVLALRDGRVLFANPAAQALLSLAPGDDAAALLPEHILTETAERFVSGGTVAGFSADISVVRSEDVSLITILPRREDPFPSTAERALNEMGDSLLNLRLAADGIIRGANAEEDEKLSGYAAVLYRSYYRLKRLQEHMNLAWSLLHERTVFRPRLVDLNEVCGRLCATVGSLVEDMDITLAYSGTEEDCPAAADPRLLETMVLNLLSNSLLHVAPGNRVRLSLTPGKKRYILAVDDPGEGIPPERLADVFSGTHSQEPGTPADGAGYGMTIVRGIAELHGGNVLMESRENGGTRVRVSLPRPTAEELSHLRQPESLSAGGMSNILTELSVVLDKNCFNHRYYD